VVGEADGIVVVVPGRQKYGVTVGGGDMVM
jgi:hypothetical protein